MGRLSQMIQDVIATVVEPPNTSSNSINPANYAVALADKLDWGKTIG
jgi:hypothetical protein